MFTLQLLTSTLSALVLSGSPDFELLRQSVAHREAGELAQAATLLTSPEGKSACSAAMAGWCELLRGDALFYMGRYTEAAAALERAMQHEPSGAFTRRARARLAEALDRSGELSRALALYRAAIREEDGSDLQLALGNALARAGRRNEAIEAWTRAWLRDVTLPSATAAGERLAEAGVQPKVKDRLTRARRLIARGAAADALPLLTPAGVESPEERARLRLLRGRALQLVGRHDEAAAEWTQVVEGKVDKTLRAEAALALGRVHLNRDARVGLSVLGEVASRYAGTPSGEEAAFLSAWAAFNIGDYKRCADGFDWLLEERPWPDRRNESIWYSGLCRLLAGDEKGAHARFESLSKIRRFTEQGAYWAARTAPEKEQASRLRALIQRHPLSWYAWLARARLKELGLDAPAPPRAAAMEATAESPASPELVRARTLAAVGLRREAAEELELAGSRERNALRAEQLARAADSLGLHRVSYSIANRRLWGRAFGQKEPSALALFYPRAHADALTRAARAVGLDPWFAWAIMRRESRFDSSARSFASAHGLMQLLVPTARKIAVITGEPEPNETDLYDPNRTLPLATWYLAELAGRFGHLALAAAAYNGGPEPVSAWVTARHSLPLDLFVETIPFRETRGYVKGVLGDYYSYRALHGAELLLPDLSLQLPKEGVAF